MSASGNLIVRTYTSSAQVPLEGVAVTVTEAAQNGTRLLAARLTDESGRIEPITIPTPERSESQSPGNKIPFTTVNITADHPEYERIVVDNVQIFPGVLTLQDLELIPVGERPEAWNITEVFDIPPQTL